MDNLVSGKVLKGDPHGTKWWLYLTIRDSLGNIYNRRFPYSTRKLARIGLSNMKAFCSIINTEDPIDVK